MNKLINLKSGKISLKKRNFDFILTKNIEISEENSKTLLLITGENGAGKTTFLEQVIIPYLSKEEMHYQLKGQDINIQQITDQAINSIASLFAPWKEMLKMIVLNEELEVKRKVIKQPEASILLMDESDKLMTEEELINHLRNPQYRLIIMISHQFAREDIEKIKADFGSIYNLVIEGIGKDREVRIKRC